MCWHLLAYPAASGWQWATLHRGRISTLAAVPLFAALVQGCTAPLPYALAGPDPSNPSVATSAVGYRSTIGPFTSMRPVEPSAWQQQNEQVAPALKRGK